MNKEETKRRLNCLEADCKNLGTEISILKDQLAEPEKPKLRLGDFGITTRESVDEYDKFVVIETPKGELEPLYQNGQTDGCNYAKGNPNDYIRLGNVFDLMKGWSEPFENCGIINSEKNEFYFQLEAVNRKHVSFKLNNTGNWFHASISEAEEIHNALGHAIAELKQKENKNE